MFVNICRVPFLFHFLVIHSLAIQKKQEREGIGVFFSVLKGIKKSTKIVEGYHQAHEQQYAGSMAPFFIMKKEAMLSNTQGESMPDSI
jgi:hypothetical protein